MTDMTRFWTMWSPYWSYEEDNFLDLEAVDKVAIAIRSPVLIIGAGQGLLVEQLRKKGFEVDGVDLNPEMIAYAKKRRGVDLVQANAKNMPFPDKGYKTSIVATGVVDWLEDEREIVPILDEARRVTDRSGMIFVAFYKYHAKVEELLRRLGLITDEGMHHFRRTYEMTILSMHSPLAFIRAVCHEANVGLFRALLILMKPLPKKERRATEKIAQIWKRAANELDNPQLLIDCVPEFLPYRTEESIRTLFRNLKVPIGQVFTYDSCTVVQLS